MTSAAAAFAAHVRAWNERDLDAWLAIFADHVELEDPVGGVPKHGRSALMTTWERSQTEDRRWELRPRRVVDCGVEAAVDLVNHGTLGDRTEVVESIEIWRVDDAGLVVSVRTFFATDPAVHDPYYLPADRQRPR